MAFNRTEYGTKFYVDSCNDIVLLVPSYIDTTHVDLTQQDLEEMLKAIREAKGESNAP